MGAHPLLTSDTASLPGPGTVILPTATHVGEATPAVAESGGRKLILTTIGSLGDLHPFIAVALALKARGFRPVMAVPADHVDKCRAAGLEAEAILPSLSDICANMGLDEQSAVAELMADQRRLLEQAVLPALGPSASALDRLAVGAEAIIGSVFVIAAPIIAEKHKLPMVAVTLQPMALLSAYDPPATPDFWMMRHRPVGRIGLGWNRAVYGTMRHVLTLLYAKRINRVRRAHALPTRNARRMLEASSDVALTLCCYAPEFGPLMPDAPASAVTVGFPVFDSECGLPASCPKALADFLDTGPPPLVFTLGSFAIHAAGDFYSDAAIIARRLGRRAVLLTGKPFAGPGGDDILAINYAPHSLLFPRAAAIIHHGGAGTTGQALRAGKPQLVVPHMGDQYDNARRIEKMGIGLRLKSEDFSVERATAKLARLLDDAAVGAEARRVAASMAETDPPALAAEAIVATLDARTAS